MTEIRLPKGAVFLNASELDELARAGTAPVVFQKRVGNEAGADRQCQNKKKGRHAHALQMFDGIGKEKNCQGCGDQELTGKGSPVVHKIVKPTGLKGVGIRRITHLGKGEIDPGSEWTNENKKGNRG